MRSEARVALTVLAVFVFAASGLLFDAYRLGISLSAVSGGYALAAAAGLSFKATVAWVKSAGYFFMFIAMLVEGPIITAAAAFGAALGYFNLWIVFVLSVLGDLVADLAYYAIGYFSRVAVVEKFGHRFGLSRERMKRLEHLVHTHPAKTLLFIKLAPVLPTPGLMIVGAAHMPVGRYVTLSTLIILPKVLLFMVLGYYFGAAYDAMAHYAQAGEFFIIIAIAIAVVAACYFAYQKGSGAISRRLQAAERF